LNYTFLADCLFAEGNQARLIDAISINLFAQT